MSGNNPLSFIDPSGLVTNGEYCGDSCPDGGGGGFVGLFIDLGEAIAGLFGFGGPSFHGTLGSRPSSPGGVPYCGSNQGCLSETLGLPGNIALKRTWGIASAIGLPDAGCEFGACGSQQGGGWEIDKRPLQSVPFAETIGLFHYYFYNTRTHESVGLGPRKGSGMFCPVPGKFETGESRGTLYLSIPSASQQSCIDQRLRSRQSAGKYTLWDSFGDHGGSMNCHGYVSSVVAACGLQ